MLGVGGLSLSLGRTGEGGGGSRGGGHLSRRMLLLERPFFPRFLHREEVSVVAGKHKIMRLDSHLRSHVFNPDVQSVNVTCN